MINPSWRSCGDYQLPVTLRDCVIQQNKMKGNLEILLKSHTKIEKSFEISDPKTAGSFVLQLDKLSSLAEYTRVTIRATVIRVHESQKVGEKKIMKQDITIADPTATATITLWDKDVGVLEPNCSYKFNRLETRSYMGKAHLSFPSTVSFDKIDPIDGLCTSDCASSACIIDLETYYACNKANGVCDNCNITQKLTSKQTARLIIKSGAANVTFDEAIKEIAQCNTSEVSAQELLFAPAFEINFMSFHASKLPLI